MLGFSACTHTGHDSLFVSLGSHNRQKIRKSVQLWEAPSTCQASVRVNFYRMCHCEIGNSVIIFESEKTQCKVMVAGCPKQVGWRSHGLLDVAAPVQEARLSIRFEDCVKVTD